MKCQIPESLFNYLRGASVGNCIPHQATITKEGKMISSGFVTESLSFEMIFSAHLVEPNQQWVYKQVTSKIQ